ncbi:hypothetical protein ABW19_dt0208456 [Dactylella cylindrospora]|nr:hypothetical protein ABW19_dt0208456 [Dactylella cylindrospora]
MMLRIFLSALLVLGATAAPIAQDEDVLSIVISDAVPQAELPAYKIQVTGDDISKDTYLHLADVEGKSLLQLKDTLDATEFIFDHETQRLGVVDTDTTLFSQRDLYKEGPAPVEFKTLSDVGECLDTVKCRYDLWSLDHLTGAIGIIRATHPVLYACEELLWTGPEEGLDGCTQVSLTMVA